MNIILFGPPGGGKGTQAYNIVKNFNLINVSTGNLLREEVKKKTDLGNEVKSLIKKGILVSDVIINDLIKKVLSNEKYQNRIIFDGFPRNLNQAKNLDFLLKKYNQKISCVFSLQVDKESIVKRLIGRQNCSKCGLIFNKFYNPADKSDHLCDPKFLLKRSDDNEKTILSRFDTYLNITFPILNYYKKQNLLHEINGMINIDQIFKEIQRIMVSLDAWLYTS